MTYLHVIVPSRGRPHTVVELVQAFRDTCTVRPAGQGTRLTFAVDADDPTLDDYREAIYDHQVMPDGFDWKNVSQFSSSLPTIPDIHVTEPGSGMVGALNQTAVMFANAPRFVPAGICFMGDDHRPRTTGWSKAYLDGLKTAAIVYGNDLLQGANLPTQVAIRTDVVHILGWMAPPYLRHLYADNFWLTLGHALDSLLYLPDIIVEHMHPVAGKAAWDDNYARVNAPDIDSHDRDAYTRYVAEQFADDIRRIKESTDG